MSNTINNIRRARRNGFILIATLGMMTVIIGLLTPLVPLALTNRRTVQDDLMRMQADYLSQAALAHCLTKSSSDDAYTGETFSLALSDDNSESTPSGSLGSAGSLVGQVKIQRTSDEIGVTVKLQSKGLADSDESVAEPRVLLRRSWKTP